jgi:hypothetical protein
VDVRRIVSGALAAVVVMTGMVVVTGQAAAVGSCSSPNFCLFENEDFNRGDTNHWLDLRGSDKNLKNNYWYNGDGSQTDDSINDELSSVKNRAGCNVMLWQDADYRGDYTKSISGTDDGKLANNVIGDNRTSSVQFCV